VSGTEATIIVLRLWDCITDAPRDWVAKKTVCLLECVSLHEFNGTYSIKISKASSMIANPETPAAAKLYGWFTNSAEAASAVEAPAAPAAPAVPGSPAPPAAPAAPAPPVTTASSSTTTATSSTTPAPPQWATTRPLAEITDQYTIEEVRALAVRSREQPTAVSDGYMIVALSRVYTYVNSLKFVCTLCGATQSAATMTALVCTGCAQSFEIDRPRVVLTFKVDVIDTTGAMIQLWLEGVNAANALGLESPQELFPMTPDQRQALYNDANFERVKLYFSMQNARFRILHCTHATF
jgi:hypothetical protein